MVDAAALTSAVVALLVYHNTLEAGFVYDDTRAILQNQDLHPSALISSLFLNDFWGTPLSHTGSHKSYRPLTTLSFKLNSFLSGVNLKHGDLKTDNNVRFDSWSFHATNVILHAIATYLFVIYTRKLLQVYSMQFKTQRKSISYEERCKSASIAVWISGLLFALHPVHVEAVAGIVGRADILAGIFFLLALIFHQNYYLEEEGNRKSTHCDKPLGDCNKSKHDNLVKNASIETENNNNDNNFTRTQPNLYEDICDENGNRNFMSQSTSRNSTSLHRVQNLSIQDDAVNADNCHQQQNKVHHLIERVSNGTLAASHSGLLDILSGESVNIVAKNCKVRDKRRKMPYLFWICLFAACSMFSKEHGITVLGVCFIAEIVFPYRDRITESKTKVTNINPTVDKKNCDRRKMTMLYLTLTTIALISLRLYMMGGTNGAPSFASADNPAAAEKSFLTRTLTFAYLPSFNLVNLLMCPNRLSFDWSMEAIPLIKSICDERNLLTITTLSVILFLVVKLSINLWATNYPVFEYVFNVKKIESTHGKLNKSFNGFGSVIAISLAIMILPFIPASNLFFYVGFVVAERVLYIPSMGYCIMVGCGLSCLWKAVCNLFVNKGDECDRDVRKDGLVQNILKFSFVLLTCVIFTSFAVKTIQRNGDWLDEEKLYKSGIKINPPKALGNLGNVLTQKGKLIEAEYVFRKSLDFRPNMADVHYNLGVLLQRQNRLTEAVDEYKKAIHFRPKLVLAHLNLGMTYDALGMKKEGLNVLQAIANIPDDGLKDPKTHKEAQTSALYNSGKLLLELGHPSDAIRNLLGAHKRIMNIHQIGGKAHVSSNIPSLQAVLNLLGEACRFMNKTEDAEHYYRAALEVKPDHIPAYLTYGKLLSKNKTRHIEAERWFSKANQLAPLDPSVHLHYGLFLMDADGNRNFEAGQQFQTAAELILGKDTESTSKKMSDVIDEANLHSSISAYDSIFNAAVAYRQAGRHDLAERFYRKAVSIRPKDPSPHTNLGAMLHLVGKLKEAEEEYLSAWALSAQQNEYKRSTSNDSHDEQIASLNSIKVNLERLHNIMRRKGMSIKKVVGLDN